MTNFDGYMGRVLLLDLSTGISSEYPWTDRDRELYIGAKGMASKILYDNLKGDEDPLSEENIIVVSTGPLTCTSAPSSNRFNISTISPLTKISTSSNCGGNFGFYLKRAGFDALVLKGRCAEPSWVEIYNDKVSIHSASGIWGKRVSETQEAIQSILDERRGCRIKCGMAVIGPAGENLVKYASVISGERAAGRAGVGAVFGSKKLKALVAGGNRNVSIHKPERFKAHNIAWTENLKRHPLTGNQLPKLGTAGLVSSMQVRGILSTRNFSKGQYDDFEKVSGEALAENCNVANIGCMSCPIRCSRRVKVGDKSVKGPELETLGLLGGGIENSDIDLINRWNYELDELGMDTISASGTIAWAMEANEQGLWKNGIEFGKTDNISKTFENIAFRRGIGKELAEGTRWLSEKYGGTDFAIQSKGLELAAYEPRRSVGQGLGYAVSNRGGCHLNGGYLVILENLGLHADPQTPKSKADLCMFMQDLMEAVSLGGQCLFTSYAVFPAFLISEPNGFITTIANKIIPYSGPLVRVLNRFPELACINISLLPHSKAVMLGTGMRMTFGKFIRCGERSYNVERALNAKFGVSAASDSLPKRLTDTPQNPKEPSTRVPLERMKKIYYKARGWDSNGLPTEEKLRSLKIID